MKRPYILRSIHQGLGLKFPCNDLTVGLLVVCSISGTCPIVPSWFTVMCSCSKLPPLCSNWKTVVEVHSVFSLNVTHPTQERLATPPGSTSPTLFDQWCGFFSVRQEQDKWKCWETGPTVFVLSEKTKKSNRLQMSLQRQHFLLIFILSLSYLKTLSVGPARVWTRELPLSRPVEPARRRSQQRSTSCLL